VTDVGTADADPDPYVPGPGLLPTPFSAGELRAGCPDGRVIRMRIESEGRLVAWRLNRFRDGDADGTTIESQQFDADGEPLGPAAPERMTWRELQGHASFEAARTVRAPDVIETPIGVLDCLRYTVTDDDGTVEDFWFAVAIAGMPIRFRSVVGDRVTSEVIVVENHVPPR